LFQSPELAFRWELRAADGGHLEAQSLVGWAYDGGEGVAVDYAAAAMWFEKAAERGNRLAQFNLGIIAFKLLGEGTPQNYELAATWFLPEGGRPRRRGCDGGTRLFLRRGKRRGAGPRARERTLSRGF